VDEPQPAGFNVAAHPGPAKAQHVVGHLDAVHHPAVADAVQQQSQTDSTTESDVGDGCAGLNVCRGDSVGDCAPIAPVECPGDDGTQQTVGMAKLLGDHSQHALS
jgi:hypothetical protein